MKKLISIAFVLAMGLAGPAAAYDTGNELYQAFQSENSRHAAVMYTKATARGLKVGLILGYATAHPDRLAVAEKAPGYCIPERATVRQIADVVEKFLADRPDVRHFDTPSLVLGALRQNFPC